MPLAYLCPGCGDLVSQQGRCADCKRSDERQRRRAEPIRQLRSSRQWQKARAEAKRRDGHRCRTCGATANLEAHHIVALEDGGQPFALDNLVTLCASCHRRQRPFFSGGANTPASAFRSRRPAAGNPDAAG